ncbi:MAG: hypothetical protein AB1589_32890 [Cyanobacteriota bacterium]
MTQIINFDQVLESIEKLSVEDQEALIDLVQRRLVERRRAEIATNIIKAQEEYQSGRVMRGTVDELMAELTK